ncbi:MULTISPECIES: DUF1540 domain-containing protein [unclassified Paenibacillus]|uniref:DUF1540 domain-containing protein n=1 Tax=unclassified Paenibacillus TaxID=185978 RepID=UPI000953B302|nr:MULTISPECIES: DUF1540 domain-containing protein [unclassified Paenibacillus]ASS67422.2 DUF1540 domain-containing protein [Paenibacillus sp. RUD330]SIQ77523.1 protein of unknown function [Paenibacillus sp. RU4X]SIQ98980.1 protein of unknown function [Paenibacillus sp. RU4T]
MACEVSCEVSSCKNWSLNNVCTAAAITVALAGERTDRKAEDAGCRTFEPRQQEASA